MPCEGWLKYTDLTWLTSDSLKHDHKHDGDDDNEKKDAANGTKQKESELPDIWNLEGWKPRIIISGTEGHFNVWQRNSNNPIEPTTVHQWRVVT